MRGATYKTPAPNNLSNSPTIRTVALPSRICGIAPFFHCPGLKRAGDEVDALQFHSLLGMRIDVSQFVIPIRLVWVPRKKSRVAETQG